MLTHETTPSTAAAFRSQPRLFFSKNVLSKAPTDEFAELHPVQLDAMTAKLSQWGPPRSSRLSKSSTAPNLTSLPSQAASPPPSHAVAAHILTKGMQSRLVAFSQPQHPLDVHPALLATSQRPMFKPKQLPGPSSPLGCCTTACTRPAYLPNLPATTSRDACTSTAPDAPARFAGSTEPRRYSPRSATSSGPANVYAGQVARRMLTKGLYNMTAAVEVHPVLFNRRPKKLPGRSPLSRSCLDQTAEELPQLL